MKTGGGKQKGAAFERKICVDLSLWVSAGKRKDIFWRSAMSGGRATVMQRKGEEAAAVSGDIASVHALGYRLLDLVYVECKHVKDAHLLSLVLGRGGSGAGYWHATVDEAEKYHKIPWLIVKQNRLPALLIVAHAEELFECLEHTGITLERMGKRIESLARFPIGNYGWELYWWQSILDVPYTQLEVSRRMNVYG